MNKRNFEIEATVIGATRTMFGAKKLTFELQASSFAEAVKKAEVAAIEQFYEEGGQGDDPQVTSLTVDGEVID